MPSPRRTMSLPHLAAFTEQPLIFLTACTARRRPILADEKALAALKNIWGRSAKIDGWFVGRFVIMPDHVHLFARSTIDAKPLATWIKTWKSLSARDLTAAFHIEPPFWQRDYFDHFVRSPTAYSEKWEYVRNNPVRKDLIQQPDDWPYQGEIHTLQF